MYVKYIDMYRIIIKYELNTCIYGNTHDAISSHLHRFILLSLQLINCTHVRYIYCIVDDRRKTCLNAQTSTLIL